MQEYAETEDKYTVGKQYFLEVLPRTNNASIRFKECIFVSVFFLIVTRLFY